MSYLSRVSASLCVVLVVDAVDAGGGEGEVTLHVGGVPELLLYHLHLCRGQESWHRVRDSLDILCLLW